MGDLFRHGWGLLYWNARKTAFVLRCREGRCPCQSPSDTGRAGVTRCEAAMTWDRPGRFRLVCPALQAGPDGWMCSLDTQVVRPYWMRAIAWWVAAGLLLYLLVTATVAGVLIARGYRNVSLLDTVVPARWPRLSNARRDVFLRQAHNALAHRDVAAMWVSLSSAAAAAPDDYESRLALAQIYAHLSKRGLAELEFRELLARFPQERARTAVVFHDVLITLGDFRALGRLALRQVSVAGSPENAAWLQAARLAMRATSDPRQLLRAETASVAVLPELWRTLLEREAAVWSGEALEGPPIVPPTSANAALLIAEAEMLAEHAAPSVAIDAIVRASPTIGSFESERLLHRLHVRVGAQNLALRSFDAMLKQARTPQARERLLAALIEHPHVDRVGRLVGAVANPASPFAAAELGAVWVAAVLVGNDSVRALVEDRLAREHRVAVPPDLPRAFSPASAAVWLKLLPLGREPAAALALQAAGSQFSAAPAGG